MSSACWRLLAGSTIFLLSSAAAAQGSTRTIALSGQNSPIDNDGQFASFELPILSDVGTVAFIANLSGSASTSGIYAESQDLADPYGPPNLMLHPLVRQGVAA